ncbi:MAG: S8 family serine peptidase [Bdellovibrionaceae bacterium]|nr:S8 family serine peptidase [Pseudobdellovibrionaceae bacterium]
MAVSSWAQTMEIKQTNYLVKFKSSRALMEAVRKTTMATKMAGQKIEVLDDQWAKVSGKAAESSALMQSQNIEYIQPDYALGLIEDYSEQDNDAKTQWMELMQNDPEMFARSTKSRNDNPAIPMATPVKIGTDPLLSKQWGMIDIGATQAWTQAKNNQTIIVAVIDSGVDYTHPDLLPNMWRNVGETGTDAAGRDKATNGIDDDRNGYVDDVVGYDFVSNDALPYDKATPVWQLALGGGNPGHGTHCAGNIAARGGNGIGISGVAPHAQIMALRFISEKGNGETSAAIKAIRYAVDNGAKVLNNSWGSIGENAAEGTQNRALREAIQYAESKGVLFVAAAGNGFRGRGYDNDTANAPAYPASYPYSNIISVAALDAKDNLGGFSNYGAKTVHIGAPGVKIFSTVVDAKYSDRPIPFIAVWEGTSMAAPHVAGAAALYWAHNPTKTMLEVKEAILSSAVKIPSMKGKSVSEGKLNLINLMKN